MRFAFLGVCIAIMTIPARPAAQSPVSSLTYVAGSTVKLEQLIGDCDWQTFDDAAQKGPCTPTTNQTVTRFNILGNGQGGSFEDNGKLIFLFGDTVSKDVNVANYHGHDPIAWSTSTDANSPLRLNFFTSSDGSPLFVLPPGLPMGPDDVPNAGISLSDGIYLLCNVGSDVSLGNPQGNDYSVLVRFDETKQTFTAGRIVSRLPGGHFVFTSLHKSGTDVMMFGAGSYRASDIYLSKTPESSFSTGSGTQYFAGLVNGQPTWTSAESGAVPVVQDNPLNGPAWPKDNPTIGNLSVVYSNDLGLWLMMYDGGRQPNAPKGTFINGEYFTYAQQPWGPWATPQLVFNQIRDNAFGVYIHNPNILPDPPGDGLNGPVIGTLNGADPYTTPGGAFAPLMIERFIRVVGRTLNVDFNISTWNPYTVVRMRSQFTIGTIDPPANLAASVNGSVLTLTWAASAGATSYIIEGGSRAGFSDLGTLTTTAPSFSSPVSSGTYYVRVRATNGVGISAPSNEILVTIAAACPILAPPGGMTAAVIGGVVTLKWGAVAGAASYVLEAGSSPGATNIVAASDTGTSAASLTASGVAKGTYYVRVRARNACGTSPVSNEVVVVVP